MAKQPNIQKNPSDDTANWVWLRSWTQTVDWKLNLILLSIKQIKQNGAISPELEAEINKALVISTSVDQKVPDETRKGV